MKVQSHSWKHKIFTWSLFLHRLAAHATNHEVYVTPKYAYEVSTYEPRIATLELAAKEIYRYGVEGNTAELGVYKGRFARQINRFFPDKKLYLFDTFEGFNAKDSEADKAGGFSSGEQDFSRTSVEFVLSRMEHPENCIIRKGWFPDTAQGIDDKFCFVSIDADLYQPILAGLEFFYPRLSRGGAMMIHDFNNEGYSGARQAVKEFCDKNSVGYVCIPDSYGSAVIARGW